MTLPSKQSTRFSLRRGAKRDSWKGELRFRSPILVAMPRVKAGAARRTARTFFRLVSLAVAILLLLLLVATVHYEWLPRRGLGFVLYGIHDHVFLPIKGYTYTLFYPYSWAWWSVSFLLVALAIVNWVANLNLIRKTHIRLLRWVIAHPTLHIWVLGGVRIFNRIGLQPDLMRTVAQDEWNRTMYNLTCSQLDSATRGICRRLGHVTGFVLDLEELAPRDSLARWHAYVYWVQAIVYLQAYAEKPKGWFRHLMVDLLATIPLKDWQDSEAGAPPQSEPWACFSPQQLEADLRRVYRQGQEQWVEGQDAAKQSTFVLNQLADSSEGRRRVLYEACRHLEQQIYTPYLGQEPKPDYLSTIASSETWLPIAGQIALHVTLYTALLTRTPRLAAAFLNGVDSLHLLLKASMAWAPPSTTALIKEIPDSRAYRLVGLLLQAELMQQQQHWQMELDSDQGILTAEDFGFGREAINAIIQAAGPVAAYDQP